MSEPPEIYRLLMMLRTGGALVREVDCSAEERDAARSEQRHTIDGDGHGYVWMPPKRAPKATP